MYKHLLLLLFIHLHYNVAEKKRETMKTVTFAIQKGGTGKTSVSVSVAGELSVLGKRTLLIDADPQGNASGWIHPDVEYELADVLMGKIGLKQAISNTHMENLFILPTAGIGGALRDFSQTATGDQIFAVRNILDDAEKLGFEYTVIDTSPAFNLLEKMCLVASDEVVAVLQLDIFSTDGLVTFSDSLSKLKKNMRTEKPLFNKLVLNSKDARIQQQEQLLSQFSVSKEFGLFLLPVDQAFKKAQAAQVTVQELYGTKPVTLSAIRRLAEEILKD